MALSSLVEIVQRACDELSLARPNAVVGSSNTQARQLLALANAAGRDLMRSHDWSALQTVATFATVSGTSAYDLASDYDRMISDTAWNRTSKMVLTGPDTPQIVRFLNDGWGVSASINQRFSINGTTITIWPAPSAAETLGYGYVSNKWARAVNTTPQTEFLADTDTSVFDPDLLKAEIKWRFMAAKGMFADALRSEAMDLRNLKIAADLGGSVLNMVPEPIYGAIDMAHVLEGSWDL